MPEPVVIIGPAAGRRGPSCEGNSDPEAAAPEAEADEAPETAAGPSVGRRILGFVLSLLGRVAKAIATVIVLSDPRVSKALDRGWRLDGHSGRDPLFAVRLRDRPARRDERHLRKRVAPAARLEIAGQRTET